MAEILSFKAKVASGQATTSTEDFLQEGSETLSFQVTEGGSVGLANIIDHQQKDVFSVTNDWTNQELADLYRVKRLLDAAGVPNSLDRGLTDEGDPWLVLVDHDGEVFIHLCRLNAVYILDSPNIPTPLQRTDPSIYKPGPPPYWPTGRRPRYPPHPTRKRRQGLFAPICPACGLDMDIVFIRRRHCSFGAG